MTNSTTTSLTATEVEILHDFALGLDRQQICRKRGISLTRLQARIKILYAKLGVGGRQKRSHTYALAAAKHHFGLEPPPELEPVVTAIRSGELRFDGPFDDPILRSAFAGLSPYGIAQVHSQNRELVTCRLDDLRTAAGLTSFPPFALASAALWGGAFSWAAVDRLYVPTEKDKAFIADIITGGTTSTARAEGVGNATIKERKIGIRQRVGAQNQLELIVIFIDRGWVTIPDVPKLKVAIEKLKRRGLTPLELRVIQLLAKGWTRPQIEEELGSEIKVETDSFMVRLYGHVGVTRLLPLIAVTMLAGWPEAPPEPPEMPKQPYSREELELLQFLAEGMEGFDIARTLERSKTYADKRLGTLYRKLRANNAYHALGLATRDGLIPRKFIEELARGFLHEQFSGFYIAYLELLANGRSPDRDYRELGVSSTTTVGRRIAADRARSMVPLKTQLVIMVYRRRITVYGPSVARNLPTNWTGLHTLQTGPVPCLRYNYH